MKSLQFFILFARSTGPLANRTVFANSTGGPHFRGGGGGGAGWTVNFHLPEIYAFYTFAVFLCFFYTFLCFFILLHYKIADSEKTPSILQNFGKKCET